MAQVDTPMPLLVLAQHFKNLESFLPLPLPASGLIVYTQDKRVARKLGEEGMWLEQECIVDRKSTRLNSSHLVISYAVFCLKKKKENQSNIVATLDSTFPWILTNSIWPITLMHACCAIATRSLDSLRVNVSILSSYSVITLT